VDAVTTTSREVPGSADPVKAVSVISTGGVRIHAEQRYGSRSPLYWWLLTSRRRTPPLPINVYVIEHTARRASGAADVVAYVADPSSPGAGIGSCAWAEVVAPDGRIAVAELVAGDGRHVTAAIAAETTRRVLAGVAPGAWTAARLLGTDVVTAAAGARVTVDG